MKVKRQADAYLCDYCGSSAPLFRECLRCHKTSCTDCRTEMIRYPAAVGLGSSDDGFYCTLCDPLIKTENDDLYLAYAEVGSTVTDRATVMDRLAKRAQRAEHEVVRIRRERGL